MLSVPIIIPTQLLLSTVQWSPATAIQTTSNADLAIGSCSYYTAVHCSAKIQWAILISDAFIHSTSLTQYSGSKQRA